jgi:hypothetical protein
MSIRRWAILLCLTPSLWTQTESSRILGRSRSVILEAGATHLLHLAPRFVSSVRVPDDIKSIVVGDPSGFAAEHSEAEPRLVFFKPLTRQPMHSNALITTRSGQAINLELITAGAGTPTEIDSFLDCRRSPDLLVIVDDAAAAALTETRPLRDAPLSSATDGEDSLAGVLQKQASLSFPLRDSGKVFAVLGNSVESGSMTLVGFSVLNRSQGVVELLPPQIELTATTHGRSSGASKAEPVVVSEYRLNSRRLASGERADGVVVFERPAFKEFNEKLQLRLGRADEVDRPIVLPLPFIAALEGEAK